MVSFLATLHRHTLLERIQHEHTLDTLQEFSGPLGSPGGRHWGLKIAIRNVKSMIFIDFKVSISEASFCTFHNVDASAWLPFGLSGATHRNYDAAWRGRLPVIYHGFRTVSKIVRIRKNTK